MAEPSSPEQPPVDPSVDQALAPDPFRPAERGVVVPGKGQFEGDGADAAYLARRREEAARGADMMAAMSRDAVDKAAAARDQESGKGAVSKTPITEPNPFGLIGKAPRSAEARPDQP